MTRQSSLAPFNVILDSQSQEVNPKALLDRRYSKSKITSFAKLWKLKASKTSDGKFPVSKRCPSIQNVLRTSIYWTLISIL